ncbi:MAG: hypothetical protein JNM66_09425 [Bryobacterales bacterium]|nr:hypothetical protein [Bryobacterales bacterium]
MRLSIFLFSVACGAASLESDGWRRQEQAGAVAYFKGEEAMVLVAPAKAFPGDARAGLAKALHSYLGGNVVSGGEVRDAGGGAVAAEYEVREPNGSRTHRAAMAFFSSYRGGGGVTGEWYAGRISTIVRQDSVTGALAPPSGNNMTYKFLADGTYQQYGLMQFTYATCVNSYFMNITGRYTLRGDELTTTPTDGTFDSRTCGGAPVRKPVTKAVSTFRVRVDGNELTMTDVKGATSTYRRK